MTINIEVFKKAAINVLTSYLLETYETIRECTTRWELEINNFSPDETYEYMMSENTFDTGYDPLMPDHNYKNKYATALHKLTLQVDEATRKVVTVRRFIESLERRQHKFITCKTVQEVLEYVQNTLVDFDNDPTTDLYNYQQIEDMIFNDYSVFMDMEKS